MGENNEQKEVAQQLAAFVLQRMQAGVDKATIAKEVEEKGVNRTEAEQFVYAIHRDVTAQVKQEQLTTGALFSGVLGGLLAAAVGGAVWAGVVIVTDYEVGFIAWGIGALCGFGVVTLSRGAKGFSLQIIAVLSSVLGIVLGKYISFVYFVKEMVQEEYGAEAASEVGMFAGPELELFLDNMTEMMGGFDILWVILAVVSAWGIPRASGIKLAP